MPNDDKHIADLDINQAQSLDMYYSDHALLISTLKLMHLTFVCIVIALLAERHEGLAPGQIHV